MQVFFSTRQQARDHAAKVKNNHPGKFEVVVKDNAKSPSVNGSRFAVKITPTGAANV